MLDTISKIQGEQVPQSSTVSIERNGKKNFELVQVNNTSSCDQFSKPYIKITTQVTICHTPAQPHTQAEVAVPQQQATAAAPGQVQAIPQPAPAYPQASNVGSDLQLGHQADQLYRQQLDKFNAEQAQAADFWAGKFQVARVSGQIDIRALVRTGQWIYSKLSCSLPGWMSRWGTLATLEQRYQEIDNRVRATIQEWQANPFGGPNLLAGDHPGANPISYFSRPQIRRIVV